MLCMQQIISSCRFKCSIVHQIQGKVRRVLVMLPLDGHCSLKTVVVFNSILSILSIKCTLLSYLNMLCVYVIIALWQRIIKFRKSTKVVAYWMCVVFDGTSSKVVSRKQNLSLVLRSSTSMSVCDQLLEN